MTREETKKTDVEKNEKAEKGGQCQRETPCQTKQERLRGHSETSVESTIEGAAVDNGDNGCYDVEGMKSRAENGTTTGNEIGTESKKDRQEETSVTTMTQLKNIWRGLSKSVAKGEKPNHAFWDTLPVPKLGDPSVEQPLGEIAELKPVYEIRSTPYLLPAPFLWKTLDVMSDTELEEVYTLLNENYVEDDDNMFRFQYSKDFLRWALTPPAYIPDWHVGVCTSKGKLVAVITGIPATISVYGKAVKMAEINFLCIHKKLRSKRLAPVLIKEVTRRINRMGIGFAVYTTGILLTKPVAECIYFHRSLNIKKLVEVRFTTLGPRTSISMAQRLYRLPDAFTITGLRPLVNRDVPQAYALLQEKFKDNMLLYPVFTLEEFRHIILPLKDAVVSYVRDVDGNITDFFSFYILPSSIIGNSKYQTLNAAYAFYYAATSVSVEDLMLQALIIAKNLGMDVFNALDLNENMPFIEKLKFGRGDGSLRYYLYNYLCPPVSRGSLVEQIGLYDSSSIAPRNITSSDEGVQGWAGDALV